MILEVVVCVGAKGADIRQLAPVNFFVDFVRESCIVVGELLLLFLDVILQQARNA